MSNMDPQMDLRIRSLIEYAEAHGHDILILTRRTPTCVEDDSPPEGMFVSVGPTGPSAFAFSMGNLMADTLARSVEDRVAEDGYCPCCEARRIIPFAYEVVRSFTVAFHERVDALLSWCAENVEHPCEEDG